MDVRQSALGEIAIRSGPDLAGIDVGTLVRRLVLFDKVIVKSFRLRELPLLVRTFGKTGFEQLLNSGILRFCSEFTSIISDIQRDGARSVPSEHFTFGIAEAVRLAEMEAYSAITGFLQSEAQLLSGKVAGIIAPLNPLIAEQQFKRVIDLADMPDFKQGQRVDVEKLMKIRESAECRDFRGWLSTLEVTLVGFAAGVIDSFLVDRVLPRSGILAFLGSRTRRYLSRPKRVSVS